MVTEIHVFRDFDTLNLVNLCLNKEFDILCKNYNWPENVILTSPQTNFS